MRTVPIAIPSSHTSPFTPRPSPRPKPGSMTQADVVASVRALFRQDPVEIAATYARKSAAALLCGCTVACGPAATPRGTNPSSVQMSKGTFTLPSPALADGRELEGRNVNVWTSPERTRVSCQVPDGEPMVLERAQQNAEEKRYYFELTAMNGCKGWLPETFVRPDPEARR
jgi:hypothetical protein